MSRYEISKECCLAVACIQHYYVTQSKGGEIKIWEDFNNSWKLKTVIRTNDCGFCKLSVLRNELLICPETDSKVKVINVHGKVIQTLCPNVNDNCGLVMAVKCFTLLETDYIFVLYESGLLTLFTISGCKKSDFKISSDCPMAFDFDGESKVVVGGSGDVIVGLELMSDLNLVKWKEVNITNPGVSCLVIRPDKKLFVTGCWDYRIRLFSMKSFKLLVVLNNYSQTVLEVRYSPSKVEAWNCVSLLAAAGQDGRITLWNIY